MMEVIFWTSILLIIYPHIIYPALLYFLPRRTKNPREEWG